MQKLEDITWLKVAFPAPWPETACPPCLNNFCQETDAPSARRFFGSWSEAHIYFIGTSTKSPELTTQPLAGKVEICQRFEGPLGWNRTNEEGKGPN